MDAILVVDDEEAITFLVALALPNYTVKTVLSAAEALLLPGPFALAILDVLMPGMDGAELSIRLRQKWPTLPVLFMSGHLGDVVLPEGSMLVEKPFALSHLRQKVREAINGPDGGNSVHSGGDGTA